MTGIDHGLAGWGPGPSRDAEMTLSEVISVIVIVALNVALLAATWWNWRCR
jgi:hypothetical protein